MGKSLIGMQFNSNIAPLISVTMPVYNGEKYLAEAIESILSQTFVDFEFIITDDGSTDGTIGILQKFQNKDSRIRLIVREHKGLSNTANEMLDLARGKWIARMDADDIALPQRFERQLQWLTQTDADICGSWVQLFGTADKRILKYPQSDDAIKMALLFNCSFAHPAVILKTELVKKLRYNLAWVKVEDYELWVRAACAGWKMTNIPEVLLMYRQHSEQISSASSVLQQQLSQKIRSRYWDFVSNSLQLKKEWIGEVLKLRDPLSPTANMSDVDAAFNVLLAESHGESRVVIFEHITRLYYRAATKTNGLDALASWSRLNENYGEGFAVSIKIKLWLLSVLDINAESKVFSWLKRFYFSLARFI